MGKGIAGVGMENIGEKYRTEVKIIKRCLRTPAFSNLNLQTSNFKFLVWDAYKKGFKAYLQLEKSLADNSVGSLPEGYR
jgi:hypothetical protein